MRAIRSNFPTIALALLLVLVSIAPAQENPGSGQPERKRLISDQQPGYEQASMYVRRGEFNRAATFLELQLKLTPDNLTLIDMLANCYEQIKEYGKLLELRRSQLDRRSKDFTIFKNIGRAHLLIGTSDSAHFYFLKALPLTDGMESILGSIALQYHNFGQYLLEEDFIDSARIRFDNPNLLAGMKGDALAAQGQFGPATLEYLDYMEKDSSSAREGESRIIGMIDFEESADTVMSVLSDLISHRTESRALLSIYGQALMEANLYDRAFEFYSQQDSIHAKGGGELIHFMRECQRRKGYEYIVRAGKYFRAQYPDSRFLNAAVFEVAKANTKMGQYREALVNLEDILSRTPRSGDKYQALLELGLLYKNYLIDLPQARQALMTVLRELPDSRYARDATTAMADLFVSEHLLDSAIVYYETMQPLELPEDRVEEIDFELAKVYLFKGDGKEAATRFRRLINSYPRGLYVNNSIQYALIISETLDQYPKQFDLFSSAEYFQHIDRTDSLEYYLTKICRIQIPSLAPLAYFNLAGLYGRQNRIEESIAAIDSLAEQYPGSYFTPQGLKLKADLLWLDEKNREPAIKIYRDLLEKYGSYPFAAEIREILRREMNSTQI